jgi:hypothetical protein
MVWSRPLDCGQYGSRLSSGPGITISVKKIIGTDEKESTSVLVAMMMEMIRYLPCHTR